MTILIEYNNRIVRVKVIGDYIVSMITGIGKFKGIVHLEQCRKCGVWCSDDDEMYGEGFCTKCVQMCFECKSYFNRDNMIPSNKEKGEEEFTCQECAKKVKTPE